MKALSKDSSPQGRQSGRMRVWRSESNPRQKRRRLGRRAGLLASLAAFWLAFAASAAVGAEPKAVEDIELLSAEELETLVAPVALYPDDLLAVVLPASTYPLQVVLATRFLDVRKKDQQAKPDENWNEAVVALLNYPEALQLLNDDLDWTWRLGEAVLAQEEDVIAAVGAFREKAQSAGNLKSDRKQEVAVEDGAIRIKSISPTRIHVPYYEPAEVVVRQPYRVYHYYPGTYPLYYYPYHRRHHFHDDRFWGVTSAFSIGWSTRRLHWHHYGFHDHPYFGHRYYDPFYYRRPHLYLSLHERDYRRRGQRHHEHNRWRPHDRRHGARPHRPHHRERWVAVRDPDRRRFENPRRRDRGTESQQSDRRRDADNRDRSDRRRPEPAERTAAIGDPATPAVRPIARTVRPSPNVWANGARQPTVHAATEVRTLSREDLQRPRPLGRGGAAANSGPARQRPASPTPRRSVQPTPRQRPPTQAPRGGMHSVAGSPARAYPAQVRQRPSSANPRTAPAASPTGNPGWTPGVINAIPRPQRPAQPKAPPPRASQPQPVRPEGRALSPEALSRQHRRPPPQAKRTRKDVDHQ